MKYINEIKLFSDILSNISIITAAIIAGITFKFKLGVDERKLYLDNAHKVREVLGFVYREGKIDEVNLNKIGIAFEESSLYLNHDIVDFIAKIRKDLIKLFCIQLELSNLPKGEKHSKLCDEMYYILIRIDNYLKESIIIYRKNIVSEPLKMFYIVKKKINDLTKEKNTKRKSRIAN